MEYMGIGERVLIFFIMLIQVLLAERFFTKTEIGSAMIKVFKAKMQVLAKGNDYSSICKAAQDPEEDLKVIEHTIINHQISEEQIRVIISLAGALSDIGHNPIKTLKRELRSNRYD